MRKFLLPILIFLFGLIGLLVELSLISFPFVLVISLIALAVYKNYWAFLFAFLLGLSLDSIRVEAFGITPIFIFITFALTLLYEKYFGSYDPFIVGFIILFATIIYSFAFSYSLTNIVIMIVLMMLVGIVFQILKRRGIVNY